MGKKENKKQYEVTVENRAGDLVFKIEANSFRIAKLWNWGLQNHLLLH